MQWNRAQGVRGPKLGILVDEGGECVAQRAGEHGLLVVLQGMDKVEEWLPVYPECTDPVQAEALAAVAAARRRIDARPAAARADVQLAGEQEESARLAQQPFFYLNVTPETDAREQEVRERADQEPAGHPQITQIHMSGRKGQSDKDEGQSKYEVREEQNGSNLV